MLRFLHSADWQIGMTRRFLKGEAQARFQQDRIDAIRRLGELAQQHQAAFMVVAGDVFESHQVAPQTIQRGVEALNQAPVPVFLLPGNHDPLSPSSLYLQPGFQSSLCEQVQILTDAQPRPVPGCPGVEVAGAPWPSKRPVRDLFAEACAHWEPTAAGTFRVAVAHGAVDLLSPDRDDPARIALAAAERALAERRFQYLALGDRHSATQVEDSGAIWYSGAPEATDFAEDPQGRALLVDLNKDRPPEVTELEVGRWRFLAPEISWSDPSEWIRVRTWLEQQKEKERKVVRLRLKGPLDLARQAALDDCLEVQSQVFASLRLWRRHCELPLVAMEGNADALGLHGYVAEAFEDLAEASRQGDEEAKRALTLLHRLIAEAEL
ncbi:MAG: exonuclease SbcCD subunit D [Planctomycetota bacterium]|nr:MAG: exonuclease SbcCD subunit D [Planctomycetota bacterium]